MRTDQLSTVLIAAAVMMLVLAAVVGTVVINDIVSWIPDAGGNYSDKTVPAIIVLALVLGSLLLSAGILLVFVLLREHQSKGNRSEAIVQV